MRLLIANETFHNAIFLFLESSSPVVWPVEYTDCSYAEG